MPQVFSPENDFLLPIGAFMERLLGDDLAPDLREKAAQIQSGLIVMEKYLPIPDNLDADAAKKFKQDALFKVIKEPDALRTDLEEMVPAEVDLEKELNDARTLVNAGKGVPGVPAFGQILSKFIPKDVVNACLQAQAGLRIMAISRDWPGNDKVISARIFDNDPDELKMAQLTLNVLKETRDANPFKAITSMPFAETAGFMAIKDAQEKLGNLYYSHATGSLNDYINKNPEISTLYDQHDATNRFLNMLDKEKNLFREHPKMQGLNLKP